MNLVSSLDSLVFLLYFLRARLNAATTMLAQGDCKLADVALKCGFLSSQTMHLVFKRELGCSPRGYQG